MTLWLDDGDVRLFHGDALDVLSGMADGSVDCVVTSPPYWGLRDYGTPGQLGQEATQDEFVTNMVGVFREVRRVLADHGTCWVNLGDSYMAGQGGRQSEAGLMPLATKRTSGRGEAREDVDVLGWGERDVTEKVLTTREQGLKPKDLVGIPWRVALALQTDGWYLRSDVIWSKSNPMPESVTDRPTKAHEYVFLLTKRPRYWFDTEAVREKAESNGYENSDLRSNEPGWSGNPNVHGEKGHALPGAWTNGGGRNVRSVWQIATQPYPEAHFATFPEELARRCILAGCPVRVCGVCGKPSERIVGASSGGIAGDWHQHRDEEPVQGVNTKPSGQKAWDSYRRGETVGWSDCGHNQWRPGVTLDPFIGSGTTAKVARDHQRHAIGIDLNEQYLELAARRATKRSKITLARDLEPAANGTLNLLAPSPTIGD